MINRERFDPEVYDFYRAALEGKGFAASFSEEDVPQMRVAEIDGHAAHLDPYEVHQKIDLAIPREDAGQLPVRIYVPESAAETDKVPVILYFHGGGFIMGSIEDHDPLCGKLADACEAIVVAAEYRLAPEHPFPACIEDAVLLADWTTANISRYGGNPKCLLAAGDSSGANISAVLALLGRDGKAPKISGMILLYGTFGCIELDESESVKLFGQGECVLPADAIRKMIHLYVPEDADPDDFRLNPGRAEDLSGMPPSVIVTAELDPLRDDGECFASRLKESGCETHLIRMEGMMHGFALYWQRFSKAGELLDRIGRIIREMYL